MADEKPNEKEPTFTLTEVLGFLEKASELTGKNIHGVLDKIDERLVKKDAPPLPDAAKPGKDGRGTKSIGMEPFVPPTPAPAPEPPKP